MVGDMETEGYKNLREKLNAKNFSRRIVIWGASTKSDIILSKLVYWGMEIHGFIDKNYYNIDSYKGYQVYSEKELQKEKFFVYIALQANYDEVIRKLDQYGYREYEDYWYPYRIIELNGENNYKDLYGNEYQTRCKQKISVKLRNGGKVYINSDSLDNSTSIKCEGEAIIDVDNGVSTQQNVIFAATNGKIRIGKNCKIESDVLLRVSCGGDIVINEKCSIQRQCIFVASFNAKLILGNDCMISYSVYLRAGNSHNMIDLKTGEHFDANDNRDVILGKHVWCGMRVTIMNGVYIGDGSMIGANSFVCKRNFHENCCIAGNPAKIMREKIAWMRDGKIEHTNIEEYNDFIYFDYKN